MTATLGAVSLVDVWLDEARRQMAAAALPARVRRRMAGSAWDRADGMPGEWYPVGCHAAYVALLRSAGLALRAGIGRGEWVAAASDDPRGRQ